MDNSDIDNFIVSAVPATFSQIHQAATRHFGQETYRKIDGRLQALRKRGVISYRRDGQSCVWFKLSAPND